MHVKHRYRKGANAERELAKILMRNDFAVMRSARSGGSISIPDILGAKDGKILAFECKMWRDKPKLKLEEYSEFVGWCAKAGAQGFLAWRKRGEWVFLKIEDLKIKDIIKDGIKLKGLLNLVWK